MNADNNMSEFQSNVVAQSREMGKVLYGQYDRAQSDGTWAKDDRETIRFNDSSIEISPQGDVMGSYKDVTAFSKDHGLSGSRGDGKDYYEGAHLLSAEHCEKAGINPDDAPCVLANASGHMSDLHGASGFLGGTIYKNADHMAEDHRSTYESFGAKEWGDRAAEFVESNRDAFERSLAEQNSEKTIDLPPPSFSDGSCDPQGEAHRDCAFESNCEPAASTEANDSIKY